MLGLVGYLKLMCFSSISPLTLSMVVPDSSLGSMFDFLSRMPNIEAVAPLAFPESGANVLDCDIATAAMVRAKKTCRKRVVFHI